MKTEEDPIYFDSHMHTPLCKHAIGEPSEYAEAGKKPASRESLLPAILRCLEISLQTLE